MNCYTSTSRVQIPVGTHVFQCLSYCFMATDPIPHLRDPTACLNDVSQNLCDTTGQDWVQLRHQNLETKHEETAPSVHVRSTRFTAHSCYNTSDLQRSLRLAMFAFFTPTSQTVALTDTCQNRDYVGWEAASDSLTLAALVDMAETGHLRDRTLAALTGRLTGALMNGGTNGCLVGCTDWLWRWDWWMGGCRAPLPYRLYRQRTLFIFTQSSSGNGRSPKGLKQAFTPHLLHYPCFTRFTVVLETVPVFASLTDKYRYTWGLTLHSCIRFTIPYLGSIWNNRSVS